MDPVVLSYHVQIGTKKYVMKSVKSLVEPLTRALITGTAHQLRILAFGLRDVMIDKLLAYTPESGTPILSRMSEGINLRLTVPDEPPEQEDVEAKDLAVLSLENIKKVPARSLQTPLVRREPFVNMPKLSPKYLKTKIGEGMDPRILLSSGDYVRGIVVRKKEQKDAGVYYMVTMARRKHVSGIELGRLARLLEYGAENYKIFLFGNKAQTRIISIPPRKHWRPAFRQILRVRKQIGESARCAEIEALIGKLR